MTRPRLLIGDFGLARALEPSQMARTLCGSPLYMAPEVLNRHPYNAAAEMWSVGVCVHELLALHPPFNGNSVPQLLSSIEASNGPPPPPQGVSAAAASLLSGLLQPNPERRTPIEHIPIHPFLLRSAANSVNSKAAPPGTRPAWPAGGYAAHHGYGPPQATHPPATGVSSVWEPLAPTAGGFESGPSTVPSSLLLEWALAEGDSAPSPLGIHRASAAIVAVRALVSEIQALEAELLSPNGNPTTPLSNNNVVSPLSSKKSTSGVVGDGAARRRLSSALQQIAKMLPAATVEPPATISSSDGGGAGGAPGASSIHDVSDTAATTTVKEEPPPSPAVVEATSYLEALDEKECKLLVEAVSGAQRAQRLHQTRADECRKLKASLKQVKEQQQRLERSGALTTTGAIKHGDRVVFVRRTQQPQLVSSSAPVYAPSYVALRGSTAANTAADTAPYFLSRASEKSLLGRRLQTGQTLSGSAIAALPPVALGTVVHVEQLHAPADTAAADALGLRPGAAYHIVTAEMKEVDHV